MFDSSWIMLAAACIASALGMSFLALAMEAHWEQVQGKVPLVKPAQLLLRILGALALAVSLALCMAADHVTMAALVWIMLLAAGAVLVAFLLAWKPLCFAPLLAWLPGQAQRAAE